MAKKMNPRKKYATGTGVNGFKNYIPSPADTLMENEKLYAKAEMEANSNALLPIVSLVGGVASNLVGSGAFNKPMPGKAPVKGFINPGEVSQTIGYNPNISAGFAALGMQDSSEEEIEVEGGEVLETPDGQVQQVEGASHEEGGVPLSNVPQGTDIFSDRLKGKDGKTMAERKTSRERKRLSLESILTENKTDRALSNAVKRKIGFLEKEEEEDKQMQEIANQIQEALTMNPNQEEFMYGTGTQGKKYALGTDEEGTPPPGFIQGFGVNQDDYEEPLYGTANINNYETNVIKNIQEGLGMDPKTKGFGTVWGKGSNQLLFNKIISTNPDLAAKAKKQGRTTLGWTKQNVLNAANNGISPEYQKILNVNEQGYKFNPNSLSPEADIETNPRIAEAKADAVFYTPGQIGTEIGAEERLISAEEDSDYYTPGQVGTEKINPPGTAVGRFLRGKGTDLANKIGENIPGVTLGDALNLYGNYKAGTNSMKNALENFERTPAEVNPYVNFGKEALKEVDLMKENVAGQRDLAQQKLNAQARGSKKAGRSGARGINQQRALDLAVDYQNIQGTNDLTAKVLEQLVGIQGTKADLLTKRDAMVMKGEEDKNDRSLKNLDAFYTAKGKAFKDQSSALQHSGKDINTLLMNPKLLKLLQNISPEFQINSNMEITDKKSNKKGNKD